MNQATQENKLVFKGRVWIFGDSISTDLMMPGALAFGRPGMSPQEQAQFCMSANRPGWAQLVKAGDIVLGGRNFGCGSSRSAPRMFKALGVSVVVAHSMSRIFFRNAVNLGFPVMICPKVAGLFQEGETAEVDLETGVVTNVGTGKTLHGEALRPGTPPYQLLKMGGLDSYLKQVVETMKRGEPLRFGL